MTDKRSWTLLHRQKGSQTKSKRCNLMDSQLSMQIGRQPGSVKSQFPFIKNAVLLESQVNLCMEMLFYLRIIYIYFYL